MPGEGPNKTPLPSRPRFVSRTLRICDGLPHGARPVSTTFIAAGATPGIHDSVPGSGVRLCDRQVMDLSPDGKDRVLGCGVMVRNAFRPQEDAMARLVTVHPTTGPTPAHRATSEETEALRRENAALRQ